MPLMTRIAGVPVFITRDVVKEQDRVTYREHHMGDCIDISPIDYEPTMGSADLTRLELWALQAYMEHFYNVDVPGVSVLATCEEIVDEIDKAMLKRTAYQTPTEDIFAFWRMMRRMCYVGGEFNFRGEVQDDGRSIHMQIFGTELS